MLREIIFALVSNRLCSPSRECAAALIAGWIHAASDVQEVIVGRITLRLAVTARK